MLKNRIGLFDSGYGGLTIFRSIVSQLPQYSYIYFGDNARAPYGSRRAADIFQYTTQGVELLFSQGCRLVILACNTASATSLRRIQQQILPQHYPDRRVLGIIVPTVEQITDVTYSITHTVGLLATAHTVASRAYELEIAKRNKSVRVVSLACAELASQVEEGTTEKQLQQSVQFCLKELQNKAGDRLDSVLLGCTHFELIAGLIKRHLPPSVTLYKQPDIVAKSLDDYLQRHSNLAATLSRQGQQLFITSSHPQKVSTRASHLLGHPVRYRKVKMLLYI